VADEAAIAGVAADQLKEDVNLGMTTALCWRAALAVRHGDRAGKMAPDRKRGQWFPGKHRAVRPYDNQGRPLPAYRQTDTAAFRDRRAGFERPRIAPLLCRPFSAVFWSCATSAVRFFESWAVGVSIRDYRGGETLCERALLNISGETGKMTAGSRGATPQRHRKHDRLCSRAVSIRLRRI
jgi:hypothetical protein